MGGEMATETPFALPLAVRAIPYREDKADIVDDCDLLIAMTVPVEQARKIVRAVNSFEAMREALRNMLDLVESMTERGGEVRFVNNCDQVRELRAALALAEKEGG